MSTIQVMVRQQRTFSNMPSQYIVSALCTTLAGITTEVNGAYQAIIDMYADNWSSFVRKGTTDFERDEWVKRNFKAVAKDFESAIKNIDERFDNKHQTYKNCKSVLAKCAYAMIDIDGKSLVDLKKELQTKGEGESLHAMLTRLCKGIAPVDSETDETKYTQAQYADAGILMDDPTILRRALECLTHAYGVGNTIAMCQVLQIEAAGGKAATDSE